MSETARRPVLSTPALVAGAAAIVLAFAALYRVAFALFVSPGGMMLAGVIAHAVGTGVAMIVELPSPERTLWNISRRLSIALICGVVIWAIFQVLSPALARAATAIYVEYWWLEAILVMAVAVCACGIALRKLEPSWPRYAAPLAIVAILTTSLTLTAMVYRAAQQYQPGTAPGGPNTGPRMPPPPDK